MEYGSDAPASTPVELVGTKRRFLTAGILFLLAFAVRSGASIIASRTSPPLLLPFGTQWNDLYASYTVWARAVLDGMNPYTSLPFGLTYAYPPGFVASMIPFFLAGVPQLLMILADSGAAVLVYLLAKRWASPKLAAAAGIAYAVLPFFVIYEGYTPMSEEPMFFFLLLSFYFAYERRELPAALSFGAALLMKQDAFFALPIILLTFVRLGLKPKALFASVGVFAAVSLPPLVLSPLGYVANISYGILYPISKVAQGSATIVISSSIPQTILNTYGGAILPILIVFAAVLLWSERRRENFPVFSAAALGAVIISSLVVLGLVDPFNYRFLLVYGFLLAASSDVFSFGTAATLSLLAAYFPAGPFQAVLALAAVIAFALAQPDETDSRALEQGHAQRITGPQTPPSQSLRCVSGSFFPAWQEQGWAPVLAPTLRTDEGLTHPGRLRCGGEPFAE